MKLNHFQFRMTQEQDLSFLSSRLRFRSSEYQLVERNVKFNDKWKLSLGVCCLNVIWIERYNH